MGQAWFKIRLNGSKGGFLESRGLSGVLRKESLTWLFLCDFKVETSRCDRLIAKYCRPFFCSLKGGMGRSGNLYMFILLLCIGCACSATV